jgi:uncharacterized protein GlcG (DUF336 family)
VTIRQVSVSLEDAQRVIAAGQDKAGKIGAPSNVAVVDMGGNLVAHIRMDNAWVGSVDISINKAFTARAFDIATKDLAENAQPRRAILRHPELQPWAGDDLRRRHPAPPRRSGRRGSGS